MVTKLDETIVDEIEHMISEIEVYGSRQTGPEVLHAFCARMGFKLDEGRIAKRIARMREALNGGISVSE